jgi:hypothetical protein
MEMPLKLVSAFWPEEKRESDLVRVGDAYEEAVRKEIGGDDKEWEGEWEAVCAWGWKA